MLDSLLKAGLVALHPGRPNAEVFVKQRSSAKAALIVNMKVLNNNCPTTPPKFRLPTLLQIGIFLHRASNMAPCPSLVTLDLANCFRSLQLPESNWGAI